MGRTRMSATSRTGLSLALLGSVLLLNVPSPY